MILKKLIAKNFMSIGDNAWEIDFSIFGNGEIVVINGVNNDVGDHSSNASGKSIFLELILFALFEKTLRGLSKEKCVNNNTKKNMSITLYVDDLKIVRQRQPTNFELWKDPDGKFDKKEHNITESSMALTQARLEKELGFGFKTCINTCCFGQHNDHSFISLESQERKILIESLLRLIFFSQYEKKTKDLLKEIRSKIELLSSQYHIQDDRIKSDQNKLNIMIQKSVDCVSFLKREIEDIDRKIKEQKDKNYSSILEDWCKYDKSQEKIKILNEKDSVILNKKMKIQKDLQPIIYRIQKIDEDLKNIKNMKGGVRCKSCYMEVDPSNYISLIKDLELERQQKTSLLNEPSQELKELNNQQKSIQKDRTELENIRKPIISKEEISKSSSRIEEYEKQIEEKKKKNNFNPYTEIIEELNKSIDENKLKLSSIRDRIKKEEEIIPYYEFWIKGFGEKGIKTYVIDHILPLINQQINYWLQFLIDNKIIVNFDKYLNAEIKRGDDLGEFTYEQGSGGEKKRIDLAIMFAFAYIMRIRSNINTNILFLDEMAESIDTSGIEGVYKSLLELSKDKIVFIITHREDLINKLKGRRKITIVKENGFSKILSLDEYID